MGIDNAGAQLLFAAKATGADFARSLMIGRQFFYPDRAALGELLRDHHIEREPDEVLGTAKGWGEEFFRMLGAQSVDSMDTSSFEGASVLHDLNQPIPDALRERFTAIYDGGTLEHVFNYPQAVRNCMEMLAVGGTFVQYAPGNNFIGHGFYQFSPELLYRVFSPENGFEVSAVLLHESIRGGRWYKVTDPAHVGKRVQMTNRLATSICTIARRVRRVPVLATTPQQSDYAAGWQASGPSGGVYQKRASWKSRAAIAAQRWLPESVERLVRVLHTPSLTDQPDCFQRVGVSHLIQGKWT